MSNGWVVRQLGDVATIQQGRTLATAHMRGGDHPVFGANGVIGWHNTGHYDHEVVALGCRGSCGTVHVAPRGAWLANNVMGIWPRDPATVETHFLALVLEEADLVSSGTISGQVQPQITRASLAPLRVPVPPVVDQRRIVDLIGGVDSAVDTSGSVARQATQAWMSFASMGWTDAENSVELGSLGEAITGSTPRTARPEFWVPANVPFFTPSDFAEWPLITAAGRAVSREGAESVRLVKAPAVAQVCIGSLGKVGVLLVDGCTNQQINSLVGLDEIDAIALAALLASPAAQGRLRSIAGQTTLPIVNKGAWRRMEVRWPRRRDRETLAGLVSAAVLVAQRAGAETQALVRLRAALLTDLLSGNQDIPSSYDHFLDGAA
jgi:type I restriction enzyme S subunit